MSTRIPRDRPEAIERARELAIGRMAAQMSEASTEPLWLLKVQAEVFFDVSLDALVQEKVLDAVAARAG
jgi:hypothetical protein